MKTVLANMLAVVVLPVLVSAVFIGLGRLCCLMAGTTLEAGADVLAVFGFMAGLTTLGIVIAIPGWRS